MRPVFLLTDFGVDGFFAGVMKAVLHARAPGISVIDLGHGVTPGGVREAGELIHAAWPYLPANAVLAAVIDPGVGTDRRALRVEVLGRTAVGPDNGLFTPLFALQDAHVSAIDGPRYGLGAAAPTFHGRDVFAPVAAAIASGVAPSAGPKLLDPLRIPAWDAAFDAELGQWLGEVVTIDAFGNLVSNIPAETARLALAAGAEVHVACGETGWLPLRRTFGDVRPGQPVAYAGSGGRIEVGLRDDRADQALRVGRGSRIRMRVQSQNPRTTS